MADWTFVSDSEPLRVIRCPRCKENLGKGHIIFVNMTCSKCKHAFKVDYQLKVVK